MRSCAAAGEHRAARRSNQSGCERRTRRERDAPCSSPARTGCATAARRGAVGRTLLARSRERRWGNGAGAVGGGGGGGRW
eukprot:scaffold559_cov358-Prasinococcus_capsulatus_cf.AAC.7